MPGTDEIQGGVSRSQPPYVDDPGQVSVGDEHVAGNQVTVGHHVGGASRQRPHDCPDASKSRNVQELFAALEAGLHPWIVGSQLAPRPLPLNALPRVSIARTPRMNSARSCANTTDSPGSSYVAAFPGSQVCTDHGSG
jgi:hypothetical protein